MEIVPRSPLRGDARHEFEVALSRRFTHVRLNIEPDGGVARLRVHGEVVPEGERFRTARWNELTGRKRAAGVRRRRSPGRGGRR